MNVCVCHQCCRGAQERTAVAGMARVCFVCVCVCLLMCLNVCAYFLCVIDVAEGHRSALLSLAWQVCVLCVYVCVFVRVWMCVMFVCVIYVAE